MSISEKKDFLKQYKKTYNPYGILEYEESNETDIVPYWTSGDPTDKDYELANAETHEMLTLQAGTLLAETGYFLTTDSTLALIAILNISVMSAMPDRDEVGAVFAGHFYHFEDGDNYLGSKSNTARTNFVKHYNSAKTYFNKVSGFNLNSEDYMKALEYVGRALHYVQDANEPHHATNKVALGPIKTSHAEFEKYIFENYELINFSIISWPQSEYGNIKSKNDKGELIQLAANKAAAHINYTDNKNDQSAWLTSGGDCIRWAIKLSAVAMRILFEECGELVSI